MPTLLLTGDVMIGRGIDQILRHPSSPELYEPVVGSANIYVELAEKKNGRIPRHVADDYVWGDALPGLRAADATVVNLETAVTRADQPAPKGINYRCHPDNLTCLTAAGIDCCGLANNHVLDWREKGLIETLRSLDRGGLRHAGAGRDLTEAAAPAFVPLPGGGRLLVYALGSPTSGVPRSWAAGPGRPGVQLLGNYAGALAHLRARIAADRREGDIVLISIHWGPNWGYDIPDTDRSFAHRLIDHAGADIIHGHSSHHAKALELHRGKPILYGCGDFLNDYEGIGGKEEFRPDLVLGYRLHFRRGRDLAALELLPFRIDRFRLHHASQQDAKWLGARLDRESRRFGTAVSVSDDVLRVSAVAQSPVRQD